MKIASDKHALINKHYVMGYTPMMLTPPTSNYELIIILTLNVNSATETCNNQSKSEEMRHNIAVSE